MGDLSVLALLCASGACMFPKLAHYICRYGYVANVDGDMPVIDPHGNNAFREN